VGCCVDLGITRSKMMKKLLPLISVLFLFLSIGFSQPEYNVEDIIERDDGLTTLMFGLEPITGKVYFYLYEKSDVKKVYLGNLLKGKRDGKWVSYYDNGQKKAEENYKDGVEFGIEFMWYENGQKWFEGNMKDGKLDGLASRWYENGQKKSEITFKDGVIDGLASQWYENGQKKLEVIYKDGEDVNYIGLWNEDGSVKE